MIFDKYFRYKLNKVLKFGVFSFFVFFFIIKFIISADFGVQKMFFSFLYGVSIGLIYEYTNTKKFYSLSLFFRNIIRISLLLLSIFILIFVFKYLDSIYNLKDIKITKLGFDKDFIFLLINIFIVTAVIVLFIELEKHLGNNFILNFIVSKYNRPIEQERVIMFLDLKDSTTIAEKIGNNKFVEFINMCYDIMSKSIINTDAQILKYVGDEVILTWEKSKGIKNSNCINFYFNYYNDLQENKSEFIEKFGFFPVFKAGSHVGFVTAAFLGSIKKQMDYSGDVMNTTARIESICNKHDASFLISGDLFNSLPNSTEFKYTDLGNMDLKGKLTQTKVYKADKN